MSKSCGIILLGANGCGKSTLGCELARSLNFAHFDVEEYYFYQTDIPFVNREYEHWGDRVRKGGDMYEQHLKFVEFAASRDIALIEQRVSLYSCPILQVDSTKPLNENIDEIVTYINTRNHYDVLIDEINDQ